jgi:hypothetical protein
MAHPPPAVSRASWAPLTALWLLILFGTTRIQRSASRRQRRQLLLRRHSTNLRHLHQEPMRVLASSLLWLGVPDGSLRPRQATADGGGGC